MFGSYFTNYKVLGTNNNGSLFVSRRQSNSKNEMSIKEKEESSRCYNDQKQRNPSRKNSNEVRTSYSSLTISQQMQQAPLTVTQGNTLSSQISEEKPDILRGSFYNKKSHSNSAKQINNDTNNGQLPTSNNLNNNGGNSMFFQKSNFESKILQKKMNEGQLLSQQNQKTFTVGNYNTGSANQLNLNKFKIMLEQSNSLRSSSNHQQFFKNDTDRYATENRETLESFQGNGQEQFGNEKENNKYFFSQFTKKPKYFPEQNLHSSNQNMAPYGSEGEEALQVLVKSPTKNIMNQLMTTCSQQTIDSANVLEPQPSSSQLTGTYKSKNLQDILKYEAEKDNNNKSIGSGDLGATAAANGATNQKHMSSQQMSDFFNSKKSLSPRKGAKETAQQLSSPQYKQQQNSERKPILNSPDIKNSKSFETIFNPQSTVQKFSTLPQNHQTLSSQQKPKQKTTNTGNGSLQSSFQVKNDLMQSTNLEDKHGSHYFTKDQENVPNSAKKTSTHQSSSNLAGSIVNLKKTKKKVDSQQVVYHHTSHESEVSLLRMENINLKNQNQVLTMKNETLEKEKKHYKNLTSKKSLEVDQLNDQLSQLKSQIDQMKIQIKLSIHSQESTLIQKPLAQTLLSTNNISSQETPRQMTSNLNNGVLSSSPHFHPSNSNLGQHSSYTSYLNSQNNNYSNACNSISKVQQQLSQNIGNTNQQQQQQQSVYSPLQMQYQYQQSAKQLQTQQQNSLYQLSQQQSNDQQLLSQINTQSPQKTNNYSGSGNSNKNNHGLSPIVNSEERSDFVSNSILEDIPTTQSQIRTISNSLVIQHSNIHDDLEIIQSEYIPSHHSHLQSQGSSHGNMILHTQNLQF